MWPPHARPPQLRTMVRLTLPRAMRRGSPHLLQTGSTCRLKKATFFSVRVVVFRSPLISCPPKPALPANSHKARALRSRPSCNPVRASQFLPRNEEESKYFYKRKFSIVNGMHTVLAFMTLREKAPGVGPRLDCANCDAFGVEEWP